MRKPVLEIVFDDSASADWLQCRLVIEVCRHHFHFVVLNKKNMVVSLKYYQFASGNTTELAGFLEDIVKQDQVLQKKVKDCIIIYNWPESAFIPETYFDINYNKEILELTHGDVNKGIVFSEIVHGFQVYNVYRIPAEIHEFFQLYFPNCKYWHFYSLWLKCAQHSKQAAHQVSAVFDADQMMVCVLAGQQLQLMQTMPYQTAEDVAWHLLNIYHRFSFSQEQTPLLVSGMVATDAAIYQQLLQYFYLVEPDTLPAGMGDPAFFASYPPHFFAPLLKLAACAS